MADARPRTTAKAKAAQRCSGALKPSTADTTTAAHRRAHATARTKPAPGVVCRSERGVIPNSRQSPRNWKELIVSIGLLAAKLSQKCRYTAGFSGGACGDGEREDR